MKNACLLNKNFKKALSNLIIDKRMNNVIYIFIAIYTAKESTIMKK